MGTATAQKLAMQSSPNSSANLAEEFTEDCLRFMSFLWATIWAHLFS
jgi:hypothetical protein